MTPPLVTPSGDVRSDPARFSTALCSFFLSRNSSSRLILNSLGASTPILIAPRSMSIILIFIVISSVELVTQMDSFSFRLNTSMVASRRLRSSQARPAATRHPTRAIRRGILSGTPTRRHLDCEVLAISSTPLDSLATRLLWTQPITATGATTTLLGICIKSTNTASPCLRIA